MDRLLDPPGDGSRWDPAVRLDLDDHVLTIDGSAVVVKDARASRRTARTGRPEHAAGGPTGDGRVDLSVDGRVPGVGGARGSDAFEAETVLLLAPSSSTAERRACAELRPGGPSSGAAVLELSFGPSSTAFGQVGYETVETLERWQGRHEHVGLCLDSVSTLVRHGGLDRAYQFLGILSRHVSRLGVEAHFHADPGQHDLRTTYMLETLADATVLAGDVSMTSPAHRFPGG